MLGFIQTGHVETVVLVISGYIRDKPCVFYRMFLEKQNKQKKNKAKRILTGIILLRISPCHLYVLALTYDLVYR